ncbi:MAG: hypothetical protein ACRDZ8_12910 [Acidimicrobiales bacterium]
MTETDSSPRSCIPTRSRYWLPRLAADTEAKRRVDRLLPRPGLPACCYFAGVIALMYVAGRLASPWYLLVDALAALAGGAWCALNFWRCRQPHCAVTGASWLALGGFFLAETVAGHSVIGGDEQLVMLGFLLAGLCFEGLWFGARRA